MKENCYNVIGVMSGTSLDGIDLAHVNLKFKNGKWSFKIIASETVSYTLYWVNLLKEAVYFSEKELEQLNKNYTNLVASIITSFIAKNKIKNIDAVCSHGHTVLHQPQNGLTLQIGNLPEIAQLTNQRVICDFRTQDVKLGGQGAPLVPIGDQLLFSEYDYCMNLGGFSNISFEVNKKRIAFDISPVNTVLNFYANTLGLEYDNKGDSARKGKLNIELFEQLNKIDFYQIKFPKSLGIEFVNNIVLPIIESYGISSEDKLHTFSKHIAFQIKNILVNSDKKILITGGGALNDFLIESIQELLPKCSIIIPEKIILEFKEALIFALLGILRLRNEDNCLASVTGAKKNHSSGSIFV